MTVNYLTSSRAHSAPFVTRYTNILMLFFPVTTFLVLPVFPGTTIITTLAALLFFALPLSILKEEKYAFYKDLGYMLALIFTLSFLSQFINLLTHLKLTKNLILINRNDLTRTFYRKSHFTQTLPLIVGFIIYGYVKHFANHTIIKYIYWGLRLLCIYGLYEFLYYLLTGQNGDFVLNRTFGEEEKSASLFQTVNLGGLGLMRFKSYTGEPSMFVFTVFPFWVLTFALKRTVDKFLLLGCLILTFSTTAYVCITMFFGFWIIYKRQFQLFYYLCIAIVVFLFVLQLSAFQHLLDSIYDFVFADKIGGSVSSRQRSSSFYIHLSYWASLNGLSQIFGIGFGYVRSTDFFSTLIVNNGVLGIIIFTWFVLKGLWLKIQDPTLSACYKLGLFLTYLILMATVPEFAYPSLWIYIALGNVLQNAPKYIEEEVPDSQLTLLPQL